MRFVNWAALMAGTVMLAILSPAAQAQPAQQSGPAAPADKTCLQNNRIWTWNAVNDRLLIVGDMSYHRYIVRLGGGCINLSVNPLTALRFRTWTSLGCLQRGDQVYYNAPPLGRLNCFIDEVQPYSDQLLAELKDHGH
jgi:Family of unknown function (DUF6491)